MATLETQLVDEIIVNSRRKMLGIGSAALAGMFLGETPSAKAQTATYTDADILNFALNLEYLEANYYYLAAFGTTIDKANAASMAAGAPVLPITGTGTAGTVTANATAKVNFGTNIAAASYCIETAVEEGKHVKFLQGQLSAAAVAQPAINLQGGVANASGTFTGAWDTLAAAATIGTNFNPYASDVNFLVGAYVFEDVGVTAYHGAAPLISQTTMGKVVLGAAAGILAVEAYHAGLVRTTLYATDAANGNTAAADLTTKISTLRAALAKAVAPATASPYDKDPDDFGVGTFTLPVGLGGGAVAPAARITDADSTNVIAFSRTTTQVLNIVTGGGALNGTAVVSPAKGVFFPNGLNGLFK